MAATLSEGDRRWARRAYFDRNLGLLATVVRFGEADLSVLNVTLQGRAYGTEAYCTMESIEAAPTPPIAAVIDALVEEPVARSRSSLRHPLHPTHDLQHGAQLAHWRSPIHHDRCTGGAVRLGW